MSDAQTKQEWPGDWELIETGGTSLQEFRQRVPGGWLVMCAWADSSTMTFLPDPTGEWTPPIKQSRKKGFV